MLIVAKISIILNKIFVQCITEFPKRFKSSVWLFGGNYENMYIYVNVLPHLKAIGCKLLNCCVVQNASGKTVKSYFLMFCDIIGKFYQFELIEYIQFTLL